MKPIKEAIIWRKHYYAQQLLKLKWAGIRFFDFSEKEEVKSITLVIVGRNDNYGGDFSKRLEVTFDWNLKNIPNAELIYVEWNQIPERPSDCEWIVKKYPQARCYVVPKSIHYEIAASPEKMPVMEYFAKNIGIRRAKSNWIALINADVFLGNDSICRLKMLSKKIVYGTHYVSISWNDEKLNNNHITNKKIRTVQFAAPLNMLSVVGNFILTHRDNWFNATGYDERLNNVRNGVDSNGLLQLLHNGLKPQVIGSHFHLDHIESVVHGSNETHGRNEFKNIPYQNPPDWGFANYNEIEIRERIWRIEKI